MDQQFVASAVAQARQGEATSACASTATSAHAVEEQSAHTRRRDGKGRTALQVAARLGDAAAVQTLLAAGYLKDEEDGGFAALWHGAMSVPWAKVRRLTIREGGDGCLQR